MKTEKSVPGAYAQHVQTLVEYDGPQVVLLRSRKGGLFICVPIDDQIDGYTIPFLAAGVSLRDFRSYLDEAFDLNYLMEYKSSLRTYVFDIAKVKRGLFHLKFVEIAHKNRKNYIPDPGFFSRNHTSDYQDSPAPGVTTHTYYIDGRWTTSDFSRFYARLSDLYAIYTIADVADDNVTAEERLESAITSYTFQGGGSYKSSFRDLGEATNDNYPLRVSRIQYASPGRIDVKGIEKPLRLVDSIIDGFENDRELLKSYYTSLYKTLRNEGVIGTRQYKFSNVASEKQATQIANEIFETLKLPNAKKILDICHDRPVVFSKLAMALYRRAMTISRFHQEGRVSLSPR